MYIFKKSIEYFFPKIDIEKEKRAIQILNDREEELFYNMSKYDRMHSIEVYKKVVETNIANNEIYLKLALLHDCGKGKTNIFIRVMHKFGLKTRLREHPYLGYLKVKGIDENLSELIKNHHKRNYSNEMNIFQKCDDES